MEPIQDMEGLASLPAKPAEEPQEPRMVRFSQKCLLPKIYDVFPRLPIAGQSNRWRRPTSVRRSRRCCRRFQMAGVLLFDRGDSSYELLGHLHRQDQGCWLLRCLAAATFPAVETFVNSRQAQVTLTLTSPKTEPIRLRTIRLVSPLSKCIETFHSQTGNGIRQELFTILLMTVLTHTFLVFKTDPAQPARTQPQFKHSMITQASEAALLTPTCLEVGLAKFQERLREIAHYCYYRPKMPRPLAPRISKAPRQ